MSRSQKDLSFRTIRTWNGSQDRAFEELCYQLLKGNVPDGSYAVRTGNPDGGVEWYVDLSSGEQWGWQAKNIYDTDNLLGSMTRSLRQAISERANLKRMTFVISTNLSTGTASGMQKSQRQKYFDKVEHWKSTIPGAADIQFGLVQESDLLSLLAQPEHRGRCWFWWSDFVFDRTWLEAHHRRQSVAAGPRYRPELQVDIPIQADLSALGLSKSTSTEFKAIRAKCKRAANRLGNSQSGPPEILQLRYEIHSKADALVDMMSAEGRFDVLVRQFSSFSDAAESCLKSIESLNSLAFQQRLDWSRLPSTHPDRKQEPESFLSYEIRDFRGNVSELSRWLNRVSTRAASAKLYFLEGSAGSGKTHLFLESARQSLEENRPAVVLFGAQFGSTDLWAGVCSQLGVENVGMDTLIGAMESAAEASSVTGGRFTIFIDALNETSDLAYWRNYLPSLRSVVQLSTCIALAVSCRDTFVDLIDPAMEREQFVEQTHLGFAGEEVEATQKYFDHYKLQVPKIPLLTPEFTVPLFLRLYCESVSESGVNDLVLGHEGRLAIFERFLESTIVRAGRTVFQSTSGDLEVEVNQGAVRKTLYAIIDGFLESDREWLTVADTLRLSTTSMAGDRSAATKIIAALENEAVLIREPLYFVRRGDLPGVRLSFQAFSDFLVLKRALEKFGDAPNSSDFKDWLASKSSFGVLEAASTYLPEKYGVELVDYLEFSIDELRSLKKSSEEDRARLSRARHSFECHVSSLPYRTSKSITYRTLAILDDCSHTMLSPIALFRCLITIAPQADNPLNSEGLHNFLARIDMPHRDSYFGAAVYDEIWEESAPIARLARWAAAGPYPDYPIHVIELSSIPLVWLLSSSNRFMRDWVTKALVQLLHGHLDVARSLFERFWQIDDPYVRQRICLIVYGSLLRGGEQNRECAAELAESVLKVAFVRPIVPDELLLDACRGSVEWAVSRFLLPEAVLMKVRRPYDLKKPRSTLSKTVIDRVYGLDSSDEFKDDYYRIYSSLFGFPDFGQYVVDSHIDHFSRFRLGSEVPRNGSREQKPRTGRWRKFVSTLSAVQQELLLATISDQEEIVIIDWGQFEATLSAEQRDMYKSIWEPRRQPPSSEYPSERA